MLLQTAGMTAIDECSSSDSDTSWSSADSDSDVSPTDESLGVSHDSSDSHSDTIVEQYDAESRGLSSSDQLPEQPAAALLPTQAAVTLHDRQWSGFKLVGDNIDKNVHRTYQRLGQETMSLHYFHHFAVLDRVDFGQLSNVSPCVDNLDIEDLQLIPSANDIRILQDEFAVLVSRCVIGTHTMLTNGLIC